MSVKVLVTESATTSAHTCVSSHLDAGNSMLYGIAQYQLQCIQRMHYTAARIVTDTQWYEHITPVLHQLHWSCIQDLEQIEFKILCLTYKALHNMVPLYLTQFLSQKIVLRQLRCTDQHLLQVTLTSLKYAVTGHFRSQHPCCIIPCMSL